MINVQIVADSINPLGTRLTTWVLTYPRFIHSEFMTHRDFSRNAASSRAIPFAKMLKAVLDEPAFPEYWGGEQKGMATAVEVGKTVKLELQNDWITARDYAIHEARKMHERGVHKSIPNRLLEFCGHITVIATATDHRNFFGLRANAAAEPTFQVLAYKMLDEYLRHPATQIGWGDWHLPFGDRMDPEWTLATRLAVATARCARISYLTFDNVIDPVKDAELHNNLSAAGHWSPFEHPAQAHASPYGRSNFDTGRRLSGWTQYRKMFEKERRTDDVDLAAILAAKPSHIKLKVSTEKGNAAEETRGSDSTPGVGENQ